MNKLNSRLFHILSSYEDFELAFLWRYKIESYLPATRKKVKEYIHKARGLSEEQLRTLIKEYTEYRIDDNRIRCPRCQSSKLDERKVIRANTSRSTGVEYLIDRKDVKVDQIQCMVCDYWIEDPNGESETSFLSWKDWFKRKLFFKRRK